jgi:hypothetical protein
MMGSIMKPPASHTTIGNSAAGTRDPSSSLYQGGGGSGLSAAPQQDASGGNGTNNKRPRDADLDALLKMKTAREMNVTSDR